MNPRQPPRDAPVSDAETAALFGDLAACPVLVLAVSGGPDSTALLLLAARWRDALEHGPALTAVTVDHGLRPEAAREAAAVKRLAQSLNVTHRTVRWRGDKPATGVQEAARAARYRLLAKTARAVHARHVLTAHTRDDQAETVLHRILRGSGVAGLAGMARVTPLDAQSGLPCKEPTAAGSPLFLVRPLLVLAKSRLIATVRAAGVGYADDPSNLDPRYTRPRLRRLFAEFAGEGLDAERLAVLAARAARADEALEWAASEAQRIVGLPGDGDPACVRFDAARLAALPPEIALRLVYRAVARLGVEGQPELAKLEALMRALSAAIGGRAPAALRRTLAGALLTLCDGTVTITPAPPRRLRGRSRDPGEDRGVS
jgi:tRNA(Ile)-lysidine synthase